MPVQNDRMTEHQPGVSFMVVTDSYKPTVRVSSSEAELQLQVSEHGNIIHVTREPEGGSYLLVADARPASAAKTRIDLRLEKSFPPKFHASGLKHSGSDCSSSIRHRFLAK